MTKKLVEWVSYGPVCSVCLTVWNLAVLALFSYVVFILHQSGWWFGFAVLLWYGRCRFKRFTSEDDDE
jgi:arginine exporter protein ArgO